uniref:Acid beta-fructofuranosidase 1, vacuolar n=1 Tax=Rosa hybrid cultivar TaxID=128735 RepID=RHVI1_ROSHC|nr:RecName: Full=Acid beta-fructofuranosidase 1, vacuolar; AltName: Full=Vacuolar invertase 1; Short=RvVI1; Flags: Precursor [Rosa hybrid cultivar]AEY79729.1 vacuolar invertase isoform 1 [Rosa hybrid cultivar]
MDTSTSAYAPLPGEDPLFSGHPPASLRRSWKGFAVIFASVLFLLSLVGLIIHQGPQQPPDVMPDKQDEHHHPQSTTPASETTASWEPRGKALGVSAKSNPPVSDELSYNWTNAMFSWQRTAFHFQPERNWMNDPNGPLFYKGWYHLFYQYNPDSAIWGNITWGHAVSTDLIHWLYLPIAMVADQWYDANGVWSGSATLLPDGQIVMLYTGDTVDAVQVVCLAHPANLSDPLLLDWVKYSGNPVLTPPPGILTTDFRDPTTAWTGPDGKWRITIGSKVNTTGISFVYHTEDFKTYNMSKGVLHAVPGTGMWECIDFYPVAINGSKGVETSVNNPSVKHVLKASLDNTKVDHYALGTYFEENETWVPDNPGLDVGIGLRYDYGRYYASKTFYDQNKERRILRGWINETDTESDDLAKGWASVQTIPRTVLFDNKTGTNLIQWPVEEIEELRLNNTDFSDVLVEAGTVVELDIGTATQLDILVEFELEPLESSETVNSSVGCGGGAVDRGTFGPFGILVIADETLTELTPIYFNLANSTEGDVITYFCADERRSSKAPDVFKQVYGSEVPVLDGEKHFARVLRALRKEVGR